MRIPLILFFLIIYRFTFPQQKVNFKAADGLRITADLYLKDKNLPFILLFHQMGSSRGEYIQIAHKLLNLNYNCLAVDLRSGGEMNFVKNETAAFAEEHNFKHSMLDSEIDIEAAIHFVAGYNMKNVILMGSSFSASLCLIEANSNQKVSAVIALSPGEYFEPVFSVKEKLEDFNKLIFATASANESDYVIKLLNLIPGDKKNLFKSKNDSKSFGSGILTNESSDSKECWLQLSLFFKKIKS